MRRMGEWLQRAAELAEAPAVAPGADTAATESRAGSGGGGSGGAGSGKKKGGGGGARKAKKATLKQALMQKGSGVSVYGPSVLEHCVLGAGLRPNNKLCAKISVNSTPSCAHAAPTTAASDGSSSAVTAAATALTPGDADSTVTTATRAEAGHRGGLSEDEIRRLVIALAGADAAVQQLDRPGQQGYILCKPLARGEVEVQRPKAAADQVGGGGDGGDDVVYDEYLPQLLAQHEGALVHAFPSFDQAVDAFFGRIVEQKLKQVGCHRERSLLVCACAARAVSMEFAAFFIILRGW